MNSKHEGCKRKFYQFSRSWYAHHHKGEASDAISVGIYYPDGGARGEFYIKWSDIGVDVPAKIECYGGSWSILWEFSDLLKRLAELDEEFPVPHEVVEVLLACGVEDATETTRPGTARPEPYPTVNVTVGLLLDRAGGQWGEVCSELGISPWSISEGFLDSSEELKIPLDLARRLKIV